MGGGKELSTISISHVPATHRQTILSVKIQVLASSKGLLLLYFPDFRTFCVFNPITEAHQLIPSPELRESIHKIGEVGFAVAYPTSDQYKLVTVEKLAEQKGYIFHVFSSEGSVVRHEFQLRMNATFSSLALHSKPVYAHHSLHWLRSDYRLLAFDLEREEATILDFPEFIGHHNVYDIWLGVAQGRLTLVCTFEKSIVIAAYDYASTNWRVSHTSANFMTGLDGYNYGFPVWIDSKQVLFLVERPLARHNYLYEYDSEINKYKLAVVLDKFYDIYGQVYTFEPTLASVHKSCSEAVRSKYLSSITATLDELRRFITNSSS